MTEYVCDPTLEPGTTCLTAPRATAGTAYAWAPGGDADAYVAFVGPEHMAVVDGRIYVRRGGAQGGLFPHDWVTDAHVVVKPVGADPIYLSVHEFTTGWAAITVEATDPALVNAYVDQRTELEMAEAALTDAKAKLNELQGLYDALHAFVHAPTNDTADAPVPSTESSQEPAPPPAPGEPDKPAKKRGPKA